MIAVLPTDTAPESASEPIEPGGLRALRANMLKYEFLTPIPCVPEDINAVRQQGKFDFHALCSRNDFHTKLVEVNAVQHPARSRGSDREARAGPDRVAGGTRLG